MTNFNHLAMFRFARLCNDYPVESKITVTVSGSILPDLHGH